MHHRRSRLPARRQQRAAFEVRPRRCCGCSALAACDCRTVEIAEALTFSLAELAYEYPDETGARANTPQEHLDAAHLGGATKSWPDGIPEKVGSDAPRAGADREARLSRAISSPFIDIVDSRVRRTSSARGEARPPIRAVCYLPRRHRGRSREIDLLFERFISEERNEPPDIDVDFEHERREEVIQYIYESTAATAPAIAATVIHYRPRIGDPRSRQGDGADARMSRRARRARSGAAGAGACPRAMRLKPGSILHDPLLTHAQACAAR